MARPHVVARSPWRLARAARRLHGRARTTRARAVDAPKAFIYETKDAADTANTQWWKQFNDPVLDQLIAEALAQQSQHQGRGGQRRAGGGRPHADALGDCFRRSATTAPRAARARPKPARRRELARLIPNPQTSYQALLNASWEIDLWGRIRRLSESARANLLATDEARRGVILSLVASVASNYLHAARARRAARRSSKQTLGTYGESVRLFKLQFQYGQVSQMNVSQVESQYETAAAQIPQIESQIAQTREFAVGAGRPQPGPDPARQVGLRPRAAHGAGGRASRSARRAVPTCCRPRTR